ncbi:MAG: prolipoprotein diacylglyceryl transferase family protein [Evtepia sp.]
MSIHKGGLAIHGGIIVGILTWAVAHHKKIPFPAMLDLCVFGLFLGQIAGRWGNFMNVEAYGSPTTLPWRMGSKAGQYIEVHPTFLLRVCRRNLIGFRLCWPWLLNREFLLV